MTTLPDVSVTIQDGAQGLVSATPEQAHAILGTCAAGTANTLYSYSDIPALVAAHVAGPAVEAAAHTLAVSGGPVYLVRLAETAPGVPGSVTQTGAGPAITSPKLGGTVVAAGTAPPVVSLSGSTPIAFYEIVVEITTGGARGTAVFRYSLDGGDTWTESGVTTAATYLMPGTGVTLNFATGTDYSTDNVYTASTSVPFDAYELKLEVVDGGALGTGTFRYALDASNPAGPTWSATSVLPEVPAIGAAMFIVPNTGITLVFAAGTYVAGSSYTLAPTAPGYTSDEVIDGLAVLTADPREWSAVHLCGQASSAGGSATMASVLDTQMEAAATSSFRYAHAIIEAPDVADNLLIAGFADFASKRVNVCAGFCRLTSSVTGRAYKRSSALPLAARLSKVGIGVDLGRVSDGSLPGVIYLHRDEQVTQGLDAARFSTLRSIVGRQGYYITNGKIMAAAGSDFTLTQFRRVMDVACRIARDALLNFLNAGVRVNTVGGTIYELDARRIEKFVASALNAALTQPGHVSAVACVIDRTNNVQSTQQLKAQVRITPLGYAKAITLDIGFTSPSLSI